MPFIDVLRVLLFVPFGIGVGFMAITNVIAFLVLRSPRERKKVSFLWWHVTAISLSFLMLGVVALDNVYNRLGMEPTWRVPVTLVGTTLFMVAQIIIFNIERQRLVQKRATDLAVAHHERE